MSKEEVNGSTVAYLLVLWLLVIFLSLHQQTSIIDGSSLITGSATSNSTGTVSFTVKKTLNITLISPPNGTVENQSKAIDFVFNVSDIENSSSTSKVQFCELALNDVVVQNETNIQNKTNTFTETLTNDDYLWRVDCTDINGVLNPSAEFDLKVQVPNKLFTSLDNFTSSFQIVGSINGNMTNGTTATQDQTLSFFDSDNNLRMEIEGFFSQGDVDLETMKFTATGTKFAVDKKNSTNLGKKTLYLSNSQNNGVFVCPNATTVTETNSGCEGFQKWTFEEARLNLTKNGTKVSLINNGSSYKIENLSKSGVGEVLVPEEEEEEAPSEAPSGGGGSAICAADWECGEWEPCLPRGIQERSCEDANRCRERGLTPTPERPAETRTCEFVYAPTCSDGIVNDQETGIDCGGPECPPCTVGSTCEVDSDCWSENCVGTVCAEPEVECFVDSDCPEGFECSESSCIAEPVERAPLEPVQLFREKICQTASSSVIEPIDNIESFLNIMNIDYEFTTLKELLRENCIFSLGWLLLILAVVSIIGYKIYRATASKES